MVLGTSEMGEKKGRASGEAVVLQRWNDRYILCEGETLLNKLPQKRTEPPVTTKPIRERHTYLHVGDKVFHKKFKSWGGGIVTETWTSDLPGGFCYVRILFQDGKQRVFDNNFDSTCCCYYAGITLLNRIQL
jgi:hypothetical protein